MLDVLFATLVVSCPCALALTTPLLSAFALRTANRHGIMVRSADFFEKLARVSQILFDKTGTLTSGNLKVVDVLGPELLLEEVAVLKAVATASQHPAAKAVAEWCDAQQTVCVDIAACEALETAGQGVFGRVSARGKWHAAIGRKAFVDHHFEIGSEHTEDREDYATVYATIEHQGFRPVALRFLLDDTLSAVAPTALKELAGSSRQIAILSGDTSARVAAAANACGVREFQGQLLPEDKAAVILGKISAGEQIAMVGDGFNDAAALAQATVSIAISHGADLTRSIGDATVSSVAALPALFLLGHKLHQALIATISLNLTYNAVAVGLSLGGFLHPLVAAAIMPVASVTVLAVGLSFFRGTQWRS
jgi:cation transport ATPase